RYRSAFREAGHTHAPRVSVSRSVFPIVTAQDRRLFGLRPGDGADQIGIIDGHRSTFGRTYTGEPDQLIAQLRADAAVQAADTLMLTIPSQAGVVLNLHILESFATQLAPALGWKPSTEGPAQGGPVSCPAPPREALRDEGPGPLGTLVVRATRLPSTLLTDHTVSPTLTE